MYKCKECKTEKDWCDDCIKLAQHYQEEDYKQYIERLKNYVYNG